MKLEILVDFLETKEVADTQIFPHLKCSINEAKILQILAQRYMQGQEDIEVLELLQEIYGVKNYNYLEHLQDIKILLELGWLNQQSFTPIKISEISPLELLNTAIGLAPSFLKLLQDGTLEVDLPDIKAYA
ncbi:MAG: AAA family ATPase, partial [Sulfurimonadaceae bacterium]|nr:AAA family ATPase [Sulfurimonadaceae bacterium]